MNDIISQIHITILQKMMTLGKDICAHIKVDVVPGYFDIFWRSRITYEFLPKNISEFLPKNMNYVIITGFLAKTIELAPSCSINAHFIGRNTIVWWIRASLMTLMRALHKNERKTCALNYDVFLIFKYLFLIHQFQL